MTPLPTLQDHLAESRVAVTSRDFELSKSLGTAASWAVWGSEVGDMSVFDDAALITPQLRKDVVLIGANFGMIRDDEVIQRFKNFHAGRSGGDAKLRRGIEGTPLEGAFLTDLLKDYPTPDTQGLKKAILSGEIDIRKHVVEGFAEEQAALGLDTNTLYIPLGRTTQELWELLVALGHIRADQRVFHRIGNGGPTYNNAVVQNLRHYASAVNMSKAVAALLEQNVRV
ncbi:hypothetical protein [Agrococcus sp. ARC_14]|uniref:hypothetical protein n=1 Tax=Agrococcus sp. ARC_14 TaxID=2919927 RepID=UPI001F06ABB4|nr:hypothetical protein [Agrococcus sp. ARC_14]MCH1883962.1 hypothetical protein [Agrococcus sp. ARC_14]